MYPRRDLADCYERHAAWYRLLATDPKTAAADRITHWREARTWSQKHLAVWESWSNYAVSSVFNTTRRDKAARAVAECEAALARLGAH